jgi:enoyl-CoA hydratase
MYDNILFEVKEKVAWITLNRPKVLNAMNTATLFEMESALGEIEKDENIWVGVITGSGEKAFTVGADFEELKDLDLSGALAYSRSGHRVFSKIEKINKPVIAGINGLAIGGGFELALACPLRIMSEKAGLYLPELALGGIPGLGGTQRLPRIIGRSLALWYILTGERINADAALKMGLVHKVVAPVSVVEECEKLTGVLCQKSPLAMRLALQAVNSGIEVDLENGLELEAALMTVATASQDAKEGIEAAMNKRPPAFKGK